MSLGLGILVIGAGVVVVRVMIERRTARQNLTLRNHVRRLPEW